MILSLIRQNDCLCKKQADYNFEHYDHFDHYYAHLSLTSLILRSILILYSKYEHYNDQN
mgnify:CR=1 FL=1